VSRGPAGGLLDPCPVSLLSVCSTMMLLQSALTIGLLGCVSAAPQGPFDFITNLIRGSGARRPSRPSGGRPSGGRAVGGGRCSNSGANYDGQDVSSPPPGGEI
jgi:hypothetical protein